MKNNILQEVRSMVFEALSVSNSVKRLSEKIFLQIETQIKPSKETKDKGYRLLRNSFSILFENKSVKVRYLVIDCYSYKIKETLKNSPDFIIDSYTDKDGIFLFLYAINGKLLNDIENNEKIYHETEHFYQESKGKKLISNPQLYEFALSEMKNMENNKIRRIAGAIIYLSEKSEIDAFIQQMQASITDPAAAIMEYKNTEAYEIYILLQKYIKKIRTIQKTENIELINTLYKKYNLNLKKIILRGEKAIKYLQIKIGKVLSYYIDYKDQTIKNLINGELDYE